MPGGGWKRGLGVTEAPLLIDPSLWGKLKTEWNTGMKTISERLIESIITSYYVKLK